MSTLLARRLAGAALFLLLTLLISVVPPAPAAAVFIEGSPYAILHYYRADGDYGDHTTGDFNDFWGLHVWGDAVDAGDVTGWTTPKPFLGETGYGRFAWVKLSGNPGDLNFIVHRGDVKDGTAADRSFDPSASRELFLKQGDGANYATRAAATGQATIHYNRLDGDYGDPTSTDFNDYWGVHLWGDAVDPTDQTTWPDPKKLAPDGYGAFADVLLSGAEGDVNFILHRGDTKDVPEDRAFDPADTPEIWLRNGDSTIYESRGAAENTAILHYHRDDGDYGDPTSTDFNDFWGLHVWTGADTGTGWTDPLKPVGFDVFGAIFEIPLMDGATELSYILHRGDVKDPGADQSLDLTMWGHEVWQLEGTGLDYPYILPTYLRQAGDGSQVPLPPTLVLWLSGLLLLGVAGMRRRAA